MERSVGNDYRLTQKLLKRRIRRVQVTHRRALFTAILEKNVSNLHFADFMYRLTRVPEKSYRL